MKKNFFTSLMILVLTVFSMKAFAQGYTPIRGIGIEANPVGQAGICLGCYNGSLNPLIDSDLTNKVSMGSFANLVSGTGISVKNTNIVYPAGYVTGFKVDTGGSLITAELLSSLRVATYLNGQIQEVSINGSLISIPAFGGLNNTNFLHLRTTKPFNEVRLYQTTLVSLFSSMNAYYAFAFDPNKVPVEDNNICDDIIGGSGTDTIIDSKGSLVAPFSYVFDHQNIGDGDKNSAAKIFLPLGLLGAYSVGVLDKDQVYPAGVKAGWVIEPDDQGKILSAEFLKNIVIETYLHGKLQDSKTILDGGGLINIKALSFGSFKQKISLTTTKPFNEIRLRINQTFGFNLGTLKVYYAFEEPITCNNCNEYLQTSGSSQKGNIVSGYNWTGQSGNFIFDFTNIQNPERIVDTNVNNYATINVAPINIFIPRAYATVKNTEGKVYPKGTFAGFNVIKSATLASIDFLRMVTIELYKGETLVGSKSAGELFSGQFFVAQSNMYWVAMTAPAPFDRMKITVAPGLTLGTGHQYYIYNSFVQVDSDGDGVPDCNDRCPGGNDAIDTNGNGIPDCAEKCSNVNDKSNSTDSDGDGFKDSCDEDSDNDGIPDAVEDTNKNGLYTDDDKEGDLNFISTLGDSVPNYRDLDSDNDGILDLFESGIPLSVINTIDKDKNGVIDSDVAVGNNGIADILETSPDSGVMKYPLADTNGNGIPDYLDVSSNSNTCDLYAIGKQNLDLIGAGFITPIVDADNDGIMDARDASVTDPADTNKAIFGAPGSPFSPYATAKMTANSFKRTMTASLEEEKKVLGDLKIYPNPVKAGEDIAFGSTDTLEGQFVIYDSRGAVVKSGDIQTRGRISTDTLTAGLYILKVNANGITKSFKLIVK